MDALIEADGLSKKFGKVQALSELTLTLPAGEPVAILGPNGAGKTTFIRMVATLIAPDRGTLVVNGHDVEREPMAVRRMIGLAGQSAAVEEMMTGRENLVMVARLYGQGRAQAVASATRILEQMNLVDAADRRAKTYSGGMRRRLDLGASLVGSPRLLLLDEPTTGLDPVSRNEVWDAVHAMSARGTDIVLTTQYLDEADHLAATIVIIDGGRVIAQGTPNELKSRVGADMVELHTIDVPTMQRAAAVLASLGMAEPSTDPVDAPVLAGRAGRLEAPAHRRPRARRRRGAGGGHRAAPAHPRRSVPRPHRAHHDRPDHSQGGRSMTMDLTLDPPRPAPPLDPVTNRGASYLVASGQVAARTLKKFVRSPALLIAGTAQGLLFLLIFRYVFGGAVSHTGGLSYVDFLVPGFVVTGVLFQGMSAASGVADDKEGGLFDRLRSLPIRLLSIVSGRVGADTALVAWGVVVMTVAGFAVGFRVTGTTADAVAAFGLTILYGFAFVWLFIALGLASGSPQAAQGLSFLVFPLSFVSSAYVPVSTMPGWMQAFANNQPMTQMVNTVRLLTGGPAAEQLLGHSVSYYLVPSLLWTAGLVIVFAPLAVWKLKTT